MAYLFVYGTLKKDHHANYLMESAGAKFLREATTSPEYSMYSCGGFPGLLHKPEIEGGVKGELYEIDVNNMHALDRYEGVSFGLFKKTTISLEDGTEALSYLYNNTVYEDNRIAEGFWPLKDY